jgi:hypothetical protein
MELRNTKSPLQDQEAEKKTKEYRYFRMTARHPIRKGIWMQWDTISYLAAVIRLLK